MTLLQKALHCAEHLAHQSGLFYPRVSFTYHVIPHTKMAEHSEKDERDGVLVCCGSATRVQEAKGRV